MNAARLCVVGQVPAPRAGAAYPRVDEGVYSGFCTAAAIQRARGFQRHVAHLRFAILSEGVEIPLFLNLGDLSHQRRLRPRRSSQRSKFFRAWVIAAGRTPSPGEELAVAIFMHKTFTVRVRTVTRDSEQDDLPAPMHYSVVDKILSLQDAGPTA